MSNHVTSRRKPVLSEYQKQIRFITGLSIVACSLLTLVLFGILAGLVLPLPPVKSILGMGFNNRDAKGVKEL